MQRGGRSWREMHHLPLLCAPGYTPSPGHREEAGCYLVCKESPALWGRAWPRRTQISQLTVTASCCGRRSIRASMENARPGKALEAPNAGMEGGTSYGALARGAPPHSASFRHTHSSSLCLSERNTAQTPNGCLQPRIVPNPIHTIFFSYTYISRVDFNL